MLASFFTLVAASQSFFQPEIMQNWTLELSREWDVLGPFPIHAREQHFLSPAFPLDPVSGSYEHEPNRTWSSSYADGGQIGWSKLNATENGRLLVSFPHIRWDTLRATEGWAALQHHSVLHTTLKVQPPSIGSRFSPPRLAFSLLRGSFFTLIPAHLTSLNALFVPEWHPGNIYALPRPPKQLVDLPSLSSTEPTIYHLFVSGDYEIRLFGDPLVSGRSDPILDINVDVELEYHQDLVVLEPTLDVACDFVEGWAFGNALGIGIYTTEGRWDVAQVNSATSNLSVSLLYKQRLMPSQTRIVPIQVDQIEPFHGEVVHLDILLLNSAESKSFRLETYLKVRHRSSWDSEEYEALKATYFLAGVPTFFLALPPNEPNPSSPKPPVLALHGAGVDIADAFWPTSLPRQTNSWVICPAGRTSWGFDWHGPSADDAWGSLASLTQILSANPKWTVWQIRADGRAVVIGHSNGGQGTWYLASRHPDRVLAAVPAAAYIKAQQYVPVHLGRGSHFVDPSLRAILDASLTPDDNDLFLSNVVNMNILAIHGGADENVPTWHSRDLAGIVKTWRHDANISFVEEPGKPHWYPDVLLSARVLTFLSFVLEDTSRSSGPVKSFTLTVATPNDSGSLHGFAIRELEIPGRLARLHVSEINGGITVRATNVHTFSVDISHQDITVDGIRFFSDEFQGPTVWVQRAGNSWTVGRQLASFSAYPPCRPVVADPAFTGTLAPNHTSEGSSRMFDREKIRACHAFVFPCTIDAEIITDAEALNTGDNLNAGDIVVFGLNNTFGDKVLRRGPTPVQLHRNGFAIHGKQLDDPSLGLLFLHPHPSAPGRVVLFMCGSDSSGLERAVRLFLPVRTGIALPEVLIIGKEADSQGVGGLYGGGFWDRTWGWSDTMAWLG